MDKVAVITAASSGMGAAIARKLAQEGYKLVIMARSENIIALAEELNCLYFQGSVVNPQDLEALVLFTQEKYGKVDVLVNNTGHPPKGDLLTISDKEWQDGMDIVLLNVIRLARLVAPIMKNLGGGSIINISTYAALEPSLDFPVSSTMRAALASYCKLFADRFGPDNIRMNNVLPGFIDSYEIDENLRSSIPLKRSGRVEEIAETVAFLASKESGYITGQNIKVDGGLGRAV
jgi:NAD(P)-dependent dehydrogenase (short-subunit alcohol dehydrogenase family)